MGHSAPAGARKMEGKKEGKKERWEGRERQISATQCEMINIKV